jgi:hypothetical protein
LYIIFCGININLDLSVCSPSSGTPSVNDFITLFLDGYGGCGDFGTYPILTYRIQDKANGIAAALKLCKGFVADDLLE